MVALAVVVAFTAAAGAANEDDEDELPKFAPGLIATYRTGERPPVIRVDEDVEQVWHDEEDRCHGRERELEARVEQDVRVPREQHERREEQEVPTVRGAGAEPGNRGEGACDPRADHRRLRAYGEDIPADRSECGQMADPARKADQPHERERARGDERHVLAGDGE